MFRAFRNRNYRLFFIGQGLSFTGNWMMQTALAWLVYKLTKSPAMLGLVSFAGLFPSILTAPVAGVLCDRYPKQKIIIAANAVLAASSAAMAVLAFTGAITPSLIIAISVVIAAAGGVEMTTRHSFVPEIVDNREDLFNAISLNSALFNLARLIGPVLAGAIVAASGEGSCFAAYGIGNIAVITGVAMMRLKPHRPVKASGALEGLAEAGSYVMKHKPVFNAMAVLFLASLFGSGAFVLLPVMAKDILKGDSHTLGLLMGAMGAGAIAGAFLLAGRKNADKLPFFQFVSLVILGAGLVALAFSANTVIACVFLAACGFGMIMFMSANNTTIQSLTDDRIRGRVTGFYIISFSAAMPLGNLFFGWLAKIWAVQPVFIISGALTLVISVWFYLFVMKDTKKSLTAAGKIRPGVVIEEI